MGRLARTHLFELESRELSLRLELHRFLTTWGVHEEQQLADGCFLESTCISIAPH